MSHYAQFKKFVSQISSLQLGPAVTILPQFQKLLNSMDNLKFCEPDKHILLWIWKCYHYSKTSCPSFVSEYSKTGHSVT